MLKQYTKNKWDMPRCTMDDQQGSWKHGGWLWRKELVRNSLEACHDLTHMLPSSCEWHHTHMSIHPCWATLNVHYAKNCISETVFVRRWNKQPRNVHKLSESGISLYEQYTSVKKYSIVRHFSFWRSSSTPYKIIFTFCKQLTRPSGWNGLPLIGVLCSSSEIRYEQQLWASTASNVRKKLFDMSSWLSGLKPHNCLQRVTL